MPLRIRWGVLQDSLAVLTVNLFPSRILYWSVVRMFGSYLDNHDPLEAEGLTMPHFLAWADSPGNGKPGRVESFFARLKVALDQLEETGKRHSVLHKRFGLLSMELNEILSFAKSEIRTGGTETLQKIVERLEFLLDKKS